MKFISHVSVVWALLPVISFGARGTWTWIGGDSAPESSGVVNSLVPLDVHPGARESPVEIDLIHRKLVVFGGSAVAADISDSGRLGDLWSYDIDRGLWRLIHGNFNKTTEYLLFGGLANVFHISNSPGSRFGHATAIHPWTGEFLIFGGNFPSDGLRSDLWLFNFTINQWKFIGGSQSDNFVGIYGTRTIPDPRNCPGGRRQSTLQIDPVSGDVILFAGFGIDGIGNETAAGLNDLWRFNSTTKQWTWLKGSTLSKNADSNLASPSEYHPNNQVASTSRHFGRLHPGTGNLVVLCPTNRGTYFTIWSFDFRLNSWCRIFVGGNRFATYGQRGVPSISTEPGYTEFASFDFSPDGNTLYSFGGNAVNSDNVQTRSNDLWTFNLITKQWTFILGSKSNPASPFYGTKGVADPSNIPGGRMKHSLLYDPIKNCLLAFGGTADDPDTNSYAKKVNDLWLYQLPFPSSAMPPSSSLSILKSTSMPNSYRFEPNLSVSQALINLALKNIKWIAVILGMVIVTICSAFFYRRKKIRDRSKKHSNVEDDKVMTFTESLDAASTSSMDTKTATGSTTIIGDDGVFCVPGFLAFKDGMDFRSDSRIARGGAGDVYMGTAFSAKLLQNGNQIVVKRIRNSANAPESSEVMTQFHQEVAITHYLQSCRNIVRMLGYCDGPPSILLKYYSRGSLKLIMLNKQMVISRSLLISLYHDISIAIKVMHYAGFAHCDLKPDNILVDVDPVTTLPFCVLTDFGIASVLDSKVLQVREFKVANQVGMSVSHAAPEVFRNLRAGFSMRYYNSDIYSLGVIMMELMNRKTAYD